MQGLGKCDIERSFVDTIACVRGCLISSFASRAALIRAYIVLECVRVTKIGVPMPHESAKGGAWYLWGLDHSFREIRTCYVVALLDR